MTPGRTFGGPFGQELVRGPVNLVKDGGPLANRNLNWKDLSLLELRACLFQGP